jgi:hypothetical protein
VHRLLVLTQLLAAGVADAAELLGVGVASLLDAWRRKCRGQRVDQVEVVAWRLQVAWRGNMGGTSFAEYAAGEQHVLIELRTDVAEEAEVTGQYLHKLPIIPCLLNKTDVPEPYLLFST